MYNSGYMLGAGLADVPTVDLPAGLDLSVPGLTLTPQTSNVFLVPRPQVSPLNDRGAGLSFTPTTLAILAGGAAALLLLSRRGR